MGRWTMKDVLTTIWVKKEKDNKTGEGDRAEEKTFLKKTGIGMQWGDTVNSLFREMFLSLTHSAGGL